MEDTYKDENFEEWLGRIAKAVQSVLNWVEKHIQPIMEALWKWMEQFNDWVYRCYLDSGAKYGETEEGCQRWLEERMAENQKRQQAEALRMRGGYYERDEVPLEELLRLNNRLGRRLGLPPPSSN